MSEKIKFGICSCLLGYKVRYDREHKLDHFLRDTLGQYMEYIPVCPEVECGLSIPREEMQLMGNPDNPRLVTVRTRKNYTEQIQTWGRKKLKELKKKDLCGYIFKSKSPSCGMKCITVYNDCGTATKNGVGIWARMFMNYFPLLPVEDNSRLHEPWLRENFIERIFVFNRLRETIDKGKTISNLVNFHTKHKLLIMSHSVPIYRKLGKLIAEGKKYNLEELFSIYLTHLAKALKLKTTIKKNIYVLQHLLGYFKKQLSKDEKQEFLEIIDDYAQGHIPFIVPVTLVNHYARKYKQLYPKKQHYLNPNPLELKLRTHV